MSKKHYYVHGEYDLGYGYEFIVLSSSKDNVLKWLSEALVDVGLDSDYIEYFSIGETEPCDLELD